MPQRTIFNKLWIWMKRFPYRKGYGVHSPFAFNLITGVIYERYPYYEYEDLKKHREELLPKSRDKRLFNSVKTDRLLFRLVNYMQPKAIIEFCSDITPSLKYMAYAKKEAMSIRVENEQQLISQLTSMPQPYIILFNQECPSSVEWEKSLNNVTEKSLYIISGIHSSRQMKEWWQQIVDDERTGITFDLYDLGLVFFDKSKIKQHYLINF